MSNIVYYPWLEGAKTRPRHRKMCFLTKAAAMTRDCTASDATVTC